MTTLRLGYVPLVDAAPLIVAQELGFAAEEGLTLDLVRLGAWAQARDMLGAGVIDAAHMLAPMPVAQALSLGPSLPSIDLVMFLSHGGQVVAVNCDLEQRLRRMGHDFAFSDALAAGAALHQAAAGRLRIGVPFPFSTHAELVRHWLPRCGFAADAVDLVTVPPPLMANALARGEVEAICVGEPWASIAVDRGLAALLLPGTAVWAAPPEKGLVLRRDFSETRPDETGALMRAIWRAGRWLDDADHRGTAAEIISRPYYLDLPSELVERGLTGRMTVSAQGDLRGSDDLVTFHRGATSFPWKSLAALYAQRIAQAHGLDPRSAMDRAMAHFRTDLYRQHLRPAGAPLPGASQRLEGALAADRTLAAERGSMVLRADRFFDGFTFDPTAPVPRR